MWKTHERHTCFLEGEREGENKKAGNDRGPC